MTDAEDEISVVTHRWRTAETSITPNEFAWIEFIRLVSGETDPAPTLERVQLLRQVFQKSSSCR
ncbi:hypothetical protein EFV37_12575 [Mesorhizobium loti]|uniref:Uncharacterized protein n=1 Tax=Mesorhizobium jarvisii TaxID=1777867 RepID=A0A6M7TE46_9HYPH|nr:hypothetical protein EB229_12565 [Mesorhizobium jarvisii]QKD08956.1 hypothetical protein EFV37_12575 [Mesorhizobium loti]RJT29977.1 hypothetical protein D3242_27255 [Mesorhizobium jarvisii]